MNEREIRKDRPYVVLGEELLRVARAVQRLHSEERLSGDNMRDLGHSLEAVIRNAFDLQDFVGEGGAL